MQINSIHNNFTPNFQSTCRRYKTKDGEEFGCYTTFFRDDLDWEKFAKYETEHFKDKDKVNVMMFASSDGSEAYSNIISLFEGPAAKRNENDVKKFFPIQAYDIDEEIVKAAQSGYIVGSYSDIVETACRSDDYREYFNITDKVLNIKDDMSFMGAKALQASKKLTDNVKFNLGDMFEKVKTIKDDSNTVVMCRNILGYFLDDKIEEFVQLTSKFLNKDSLFVIGDYDREFMDIDAVLQKFNFKKVLKNVYKKV